MMEGTHVFQGAFTEDPAAAYLFRKVASFTPCSWENRLGQNGTMALAGILRLRLKVPSPFPRGLWENGRNEGKGLRKNGGGMGAKKSATALQLVPGTPGQEPLMRIIPLTIGGDNIPYQGLFVASIWPNY